MCLLGVRGCLARCRKGESPAEILMHVLCVPGAGEHGVCAILKETVMRK